MIFNQNIILICLFTLLIGIFIIMLIPSWNTNLLKKCSLLISSIIFLLTLYLWVIFDKSIGHFQLIHILYWIPFLNINFVTGVDGISLFLIILTSLLIFLCLLNSWNSVQTNVKEYLLCFLIMELFLLCVFSIIDVFLFYVFFESVLIPMYLIIGIWGSRERKIRANYFFFLYTLLGSILMLLSILYIYSSVGTTNYEIILTTFFTETEQKILWLTFFASFATKVPMLPMHIWLPEAHVEAPTAGSVILAGVLLKLGTYGFIRFSLPLFPKASFFFSPLVYALATIGIIYTSFTAIRQTDFKRIIAYTSVAHMNLVVLGIFSFNVIGIEGSLLQSLSHGFVASSLFLIIGVVYERSHTRMVKYYGGLVHIMPIYIAIFLFFTMANIGLPGTSSFIGEFLILLGCYNQTTTICFFAATSMVLGGCYSLWLFNRIAYGNLKTQYLSTSYDLNIREFLIFLPLLIATLFVGIYPDVLLNPIHSSVNFLFEQII